MKIHYALALLLASLLGAACNPGVDSSSSQPKVLEDHAGFDLEKVSFKEDVPALYAKHFVNDYAYDSDTAYDPAHPQADSIFRYRISSYLADAVDIKLPQKELGYLYKTQQLDSVAKFQKAYFHTVYTLTDAAKKPVAYYAEAEFSAPDIRRQFLQAFREKYGEPTRAYYLRSEFNVCSYEWVTTDRTIQIETSFGWRASFSTDGNNSSGKYYRLDMLILSNAAKAAVASAHRFTLPDPIVKDGKSYSLKSLDMAKDNLAEDEFLLHSERPYLADVDEYSMYHISNAPSEEETAPETGPEMAVDSAY